ncbi:protein kinase domain-containing protein [Brevundimonas balnearis]|uniref:Winged helix-turn-helix domain-containing protein n=1 Tax=Brevundimonas balnearis TaxID=1572858 RepID=A0ABV6R1U8_9CAUL
MSLSRRRRRWTFAQAVFDEVAWTLTVDGRAVELEGKPLQVLMELLLHAGETLTRDELLDAVWPDVNVVEASLTTAISKLRRALNDGDATLIETVPKIGYRLTAPVAVEHDTAPPAPRFAFQPGDAVPGRPQWKLEAALGDAGTQDVWRAAHEKSGERRIFKFADSADRLAALRREVTIFRVLKAAAGTAHTGIEILEWNFETRPYWIESRDAGQDLRRALETLDPDAQAEDVRRTLAVQLCRAVAAAHDAGVLHEDLKPSNILVAVDQEGTPVVRLADFGNGRLLDAALLGRLNISGDIDPEALDGERSGTRAYMAPELFAGAPPSVQSDIYALGLIVLQLVTRNFDLTFAPGWEDAVADDLLREDVNAASASDPQARLRDAAELALRLESLEERRAAREARRAEAERLAALEALEARRRARRPAVIAAGIALTVGVLGAAGGGLAALQQRNEARQALALSEASYAFLADEILASPDPTQASQADEPLVTAVLRAANTIDARFSEQPLIAARLHASLAKAFDQRSDYANAFRFYQAADRQFRRGGGEDSDGAVINQLQWATAEALSTREGGLASAQARLAALEPRITATAADDELRFWWASAKAHIALVQSDAEEAQAQFAAAKDYAEAHPERFTPVQRLNIAQRHAFMLLRMGDGAGAEPVFRTLSTQMAALRGVDHPDTLLLRLNLAQSLMIQHRHEAALEQMNALLPVMERRLGRDHRHTLLLLAARQQSLGSLGLYREAAADGDRVWRAAEAKDGPASFAAIAGRTDTGISECRAGNTDVGLANVRAAHGTTTASGLGGPALEQAVRAALADCLVMAGRHREAEALIAGIEPRLVAQLVGDANWDATLSLLQAEIAWAGGRLDEARRLLASSRPGLSGNRDRFLVQRQERLTAALRG